MKKVWIGFLICTIILMSNFLVFAQGETIAATQNITMGKNQTQATFDITIDTSNHYAGAEFGVLCGQDVEVKSIVYNKSGSKIGPTVASGYTWFGFFSSNNDFSEQVVATVTIEYSGDQNTSVVVDQISIHVKNGAGVDTSNLAEKKTIEIKKEGATNPIVPPKPPEDQENTSGGENNTSSNSTNDGAQNNATNNANGELDQSANNSASSGNATDHARSDMNSSTENFSTENIESKDNSNPDTDVDNVQTGNSFDSNTPSGKMNIGLVIVLIISVSGNVALGYLYIKTKGKNKKENDPCSNSKNS